MLHSNEVGKLTFPKIRIKELLYFLFGFILFVPLEVFQDGLYLSYLQILILVSVYRLKKHMFLLFLIFSVCAIISVINSDSMRLSALINPLLCMLVIAVNFKNREVAKIVLSGFIFSAIAHSIFLFLAALSSNNLSIVSMMYNRMWGGAYLPYFGNGLGLTFAAALVWTFYKKNWLAFGIIMVGAILCTSRTPLLICLMLIVFQLLSNKLGRFSVLFLATLSLMAVIPSTLDLSDYESRLFMVDDRFSVYLYALDSIYEHPLFGIGSDYLEYYLHAHNSFLQTALKHGIIAFTAWFFAIFIMFLSKVMKPYFFAFILFVIIVGSTQVGLHNPNVVTFIVIFVAAFDNRNRTFGDKSFCLGEKHVSG